MAAADLVGQAVHGFLQRLYLLGGDGVILPEAGEGGVQNVLHQVGQNAQFLPGGVGKAELLVVQLLGGLLKIQNVVADALEVADGVEQAGDGVVIVGRSAVLGDLDQIAAQPVLIDIQLVLVGNDLLLPGLGVLEELVQHQVHAGLGQGAHLVYHAGTLIDGHAGGAQQAGIQEGKVGGLVLSGDSLLGQPFQLAGEGQQQKGGTHVENRVAEGDAHGIDGFRQEGEAENGVAAAQDNEAHDSADQVEGDVDHGHPLGVAADADGGDQGGDTGADVLAHDDGDGHAVGDGAGHSQGLQNTHGGGGGLDDAGEGRAHQHAQQGIGEGGHQFGELRHIRQRGHGAAHQFHAVHQDGKAHHHPAHVPAALLFRAHDEQDARQGHQGGEVLGLEKVDKEAVALNAGEGQEPRRQGGADVGTHDDPDGLAQFHNTGVYQAHQHDRHSGGGLDGDGDARAQKQALDGVGGHTLEKALQPSAGHLFQAFGHNRHAVEEKGQSAAEGEEGENIHKPGSFLWAAPPRGCLDRTRIDRCF